MKYITYEQVQLDNTAVALGKFQGLHNGHMLLVDKILELSKKEGFTSTLFTINMDSAKKINTKKDREDIISELGVDVQVDCTFSPEFAAMRPYAFIRDVLNKKLGAKYVVVGSDFCFGYKRQGNVDTLLDYQNEFGYKVIAIDKLSIAGACVSSTAVREYIQKGEMEAAAAYMGRSYFVKGIVNQGRMLGRTIGFPTVNIYPAKDKLLPPYGAYETRVKVDGKIYKGITNIGDNPTISSDNDVTIETHILDYEGDLYGLELKIEFVRYIREQKKFKDVEELRKQLEIDKNAVKHQ